MVVQLVNLKGLLNVLSKVSLTFIAPIIHVMPKTSPIFAILEPITLFIAIEGNPLMAAFKLIINSGREVAKATTVIPITILEILNLNEIAIEERTINSPPMTRRKNPKKINAKFILFNNNFRIY